MGLEIKTLSLKNWRNIKDKKIQFNKNLSILLGPNASGKTNTLEAIQMLSSGATFYHTHTDHLLQNGKKEGKIEGTYEGDKRKINLSVMLTKDGEAVKKQLFKNGKKEAQTHLLGMLPTILFTPNHLSLIKDSAHVRREELNRFCSQVSLQYHDVLKSYNRALKQRNNLLKDPFLEKTMLGVWDEALALGGATLFQARAKMITHLTPYIQKAYHAFSPSEKLSVLYKPALPTAQNVAQDLDRAASNSDSHSLSPQSALDQTEKVEIQETFLKALQSSFSDDIKHGFTLFGPQKDDIVFLLNDKDARTFASQGQQRSLVLAWKLALVHYTEDFLGQTPLLLLDDVMSELDEVRREAITAFLKEDVQTIITTTHLGYFSEKTLEKADIIHYP